MYFTDNIVRKVVRASKRKNYASQYRWHSSKCIIYNAQILTDGKSTTKEKWLELNLLNWRFVEVFPYAQVVETGRSTMEEKWCELNLQNLPFIEAFHKAQVTELGMSTEEEK